MVRERSYGTLDFPGHPMCWAGGKGAREPFLRGRRLSRSLSLFLVFPPFPHWSKRSRGFLSEPANLLLINHHSRTD